MRVRRRPADEGAGGPDRRGTFTHTRAAVCKLVHALVWLSTSLSDSTVHWQCEKQCRAAWQMANFDVSPTEVEVHTDAAKYTKSTASPLFPLFILPLSFAHPSLLPSARKQVGGRKRMVRRITRSLRKKLKMPGGTHDLRRRDRCQFARWRPRLCGNRA